LTGRIECKLTAITPLFVADAEGVEEDANHKGHYHYRFFRYEDQPALPATSLRGVIRSVFEAVTNSCFGIFNADKRLSYHLQPGEALKLIPARVVQEKDNWYLELLPGATPVAVGQRPSGPQYAAWVRAYNPIQSSRTVRNAPNSDYSRRPTLSLKGWEHNEPCQALIEKVQHPRRRFTFWNVVALAKPGASLPRPTAGQRVVQGYICITNQNIENKHDERVFFHAGGSPVRIPLLPEVRKRYDELISDYQERHADEVKKRKHPGVPQGKDPAFSWFIYERTNRDHKLRDGDLVYAMLQQSPHGPYLDFIVPVSVPRVGYDQTIGERLDPRVPPEESLRHTCIQYNELCPACRTFGWVRPDAPRDTDVPVAYAGRVRFHHGKLTSSAGTLEEEILAILSTPKPTTTRFYLRPADGGKPRDGREDERVGYDQSGHQQLRGRKFYRHHGEQLAQQEYGRAGDKQDDQNRTIHGAQMPGSTFKFSVDFENLTPVELGALIWSLELEGWHHRLGMAKPLGFGSATVEVTELETIDLETRYTSLDAGWETRLEEREGYIQAFKAAMEERYGKPFEKLDNVRDIQALLAASPDLPVHYPRSSRIPDPEGKNFEWFMGNKRGGRNAGPRIELPLAEDDTEGLPLIDKRGQKV
jgi:CRISPR-associated protein (TIGR03986 family)